MKKSKGIVVKMDLSKDYDRVSWLYLRIFLTHLGFEVPSINSVMRYISTTKFTFLINGEASPFFHAERGLRQGCPFSPLLFLLVAKGLSWALVDEKVCGLFHGIEISHALSLTHLFFVDYFLLFCTGL